MIQRSESNGSCGHSARRSVLRDCCARRAPARALREPASRRRPKPARRRPVRTSRRPCRFPVHAAGAPLASASPMQPSCRARRGKARCRERRRAQAAGRTPSRSRTPAADCSEPPAAPISAHIGRPPHPPDFNAPTNLRRQPERGKEDQQQRIAQRIGERHLETECRRSRMASVIAIVRPPLTAGGMLYGASTGHRAIDAHAEQDRYQCGDTGPQFIQCDRHPPDPLRCSCRVLGRMAPLPSPPRHSRRRIRWRMPRPRGRAHAASAPSARSARA